MSLKEDIKKCRLCLKTGGTYINLFQGNFDKFIMELTSIKISLTDGLPKVACINCIDDVQQAIKTRKRILESNEILKKSKNLKEEPSQSYPEVVILDDLSDDLKEELNDDVLSPGIGEMLSSYEDFDENDEDRLEDFDIKEDLLNDDNLTFVYHDVDEDITDGNIKPLIHESKKPKIRFTNRRTKPTNTDINVIFNSDNRKNRFSSDKGNFKCDECDVEFQNKYSHYLHTLKHKKSQCKICGIFIRSDNMSKHIDCHTSGPRMCDLCGKTCKNTESLRGHIFYMHRKTADEYKCDQCDKSFRMKYKMELHKKKAHIGVRTHKCATCKKGFFTVRDLNHHVKMKHLKLRPHICPHCSRGFSSRYALKTHVRQHTNETPYKCYVCAEGFRQNVSLRTHLKSKHNIEEAKDFQCEFCTKAFSSEFALNIHLRLHSDENYKCEKCDETFKQKIFLANHLKYVHQIDENLIYIRDIGDIDDVNENEEN